MPLISIVMCTFDREAMARRTIASVYAQILPVDVDFEVIVVDNTGAGDAREWVASLCDLEPAPRYIHAPSPGISHARNAGVATARGISSRSSMTMKSRSPIGLETSTAR